MSFQRRAVFGGFAGVTYMKCAACARMIRAAPVVIVQCKSLRFTELAISNKV